MSAYGSHHNETQPLLADGERSPQTGRYLLSQASTAAFSILLWIFLVDLIYEAFVSTQYYSLLAGPQYAIGISVVMGTMHCFYPLAGFMGDVIYGRYKMLVGSLNILTVVCGVACLVTAILLLLYFILKINIIVLILLLIIGLLILVLLPGIIGFRPNAFQFGLDQLQNSPRDHQSLYIYWYVWVTNLGTLLIAFMFQYGRIISVTIPVGFALFVISLSFVASRFMTQPFLVDSARPNPYGLVYRVTKFAFKRSSMWCCVFGKRESPTGLDLAKDSYGGPFTFEEVEVVKTFYGVVRVVLAAQGVSFLKIATGPALLFYAEHISLYKYDFTKTWLLYINCISPFLVTVFIPLYICLLRRFFIHYIPGMFRRIGLGIILIIVTLACIFAMDTAFHLKIKESYNNMFVIRYTDINNIDPFSFLWTGTETPFIVSTTDSTLPSMEASQNTFFLIAPYFLSAFSTILVYTALYEFICLQSPPSMKSFIIGLSFAVKGFMEVLGVSYMAAFSLWSNSFPSVGMYYYLANIILGIFCFLDFIRASRRYKFREEEELQHLGVSQIEEQQSHGHS